MGRARSAPGAELLLLSTPSERRSGGPCILFKKFGIVNDEHGFANRKDK
jgi:hypothetical protein